MPRFPLPTPAPFAFDHTRSALEGFGASAVTRELAPAAFRQAWRASPGSVPRVVTVRSLGSLERPRLEAEVDGPLEDAERAGLERAITRSLALNLDVRPLEEVRDPAFAAVLDTLRGYHPPRFTSSFEAACWTVVRQRTPLGFALASMRRLVEALGVRVLDGGGVFTAFPEPAAVADDARPALLAATNNTRKVDRLVGVARAFASIDPDWLWSASYDDAYRWLLTVPGMGPWSAELVLQRALGRFERVPWTDTGALPAISRVYTAGFSIARGSARELAERYGWLQGLWLQYLKRYVYTLRLA